MTTTRDPAHFTAKTWNRNYTPTHAIYIDPRDSRNEKGEVVGSSMGGPVAWVDNSDNATELAAILNKHELDRVDAGQPYRMFVMGNYGFEIHYGNDRATMEAAIRKAMEDKTTCCAVLYERTKHRNPDRPEYHVTEWAMEQYSDRMG